MLLSRLPITTTLSNGGVPWQLAANLVRSLTSGQGLAAFVLHGLRFSEYLLALKLPSQPTNFASGCFPNIDRNLGHLPV